MYQNIPESIDGQMTGKMLHLNEAGQEVDPVTESVVLGHDAVMLELEQPKIIDATPPAAPEVAPLPEG